MAECVGCGRALFGKGNPDGYRIEPPPGIDKEAYVCPGRGHYASENCALKARQKWARCPGCGDEHAKVGTICYRCKENLSQVAAMAERASKLTWWSINGRAIGPWLTVNVPVRDGQTRDYIFPKEELAELLGKAVAAGRGPVGYYDQRGHCDYEHQIPGPGDGPQGQVFIEMTDEAGAALKEFIHKLAQVMHLQYLDGYRAGSNALGRLMSGDATVTAFEEALQNANDTHGRAARRYGGDE